MRVLITALAFLVIAFAYAIGDLSAVMALIFAVVCGVGSLALCLAMALCLAAARADAAMARLMDAACASGDTTALRELEHEL